MVLPRLGISFGTSDIKVIWMSRAGMTNSIETIPMPQRIEQHRVEHSPNIALERIRSIPDRFRFRGEWEAALASHRSTFILWERETGKSVTPLVNWRDRRGRDWIQSLSDSLRQEIHSVSGLRPQAGHPLSKIRWFLEQDPGLRSRAENGDLCYGCVDNWLIWKGTRGREYWMTPEQARHTLLYDPERNQWSRSLMERCDIPPALMPEIRDAMPGPIDSRELWPNSRIVNLIDNEAAATIGSQPSPYPKTRISLGAAGFLSAPCEDDQCPPGLIQTTTPDSSGTLHPRATGVVLSAHRAVRWVVNVFGVTHDTFHSWVRPPWPREIPQWCPSYLGVGAPFWSDRPASIRDLFENSSAKQLSLGLAVSILHRMNDILHQLPERGNVRIVVNGSLTRIPQLNRLAAALWDLPTANILTPHVAARGALIASHWRKPYLQSDPWSSLEVEVVLPAREAPVEAWKEDWQRALEDWDLHPVS